MIYTHIKVARATILFLLNFYYTPKIKFSLLIKRDTMR